MNLHIGEASWRSSKGQPGQAECALMIDIGALDETEDESPEAVSTENSLALTVLHEETMAEVPFDEDALENVENDGPVQTSDMQTSDVKASEKDPHQIILEHPLPKNPIETGDRVQLIDKDGNFIVEFIIQNQDRLPTLIRDWARAFKVVHNKPLQIIFLEFAKALDTDPNLQPDYIEYCAVSGRMLQKTFKYYGFNHAFEGTTELNSIYTLYTEAKHMIFTFKGTGQPFPQLAMDWQNAIDVMKSDTTELITLRFQPETLLSPEYVDYSGRTGKLLERQVKVPHLTEAIHSPSEAQTTYSFYNTRQQLIFRMKGDGSSFPPVTQDWHKATSVTRNDNTNIISLTFSGKDGEPEFIEYDGTTGQVIESHIKVVGFKQIDAPTLAAEQTTYHFYNERKELILTFKAGGKFPRMLKDWPNAIDAKRDDIGKTVTLIFPKEDLNPETINYSLLTGKILETHVSIRDFNQVFPAESIEGIHYDLYTPEGVLLLSYRGTGQPFPQLMQDWPNALSVQKETRQIRLDFEKQHALGPDYKLYDIFNGACIQTHINIVGFQNTFAQPPKEAVFYNLYDVPDHLVMSLASADGSLADIIQDWPLAESVEKKGKILRMNFTAQGLEPAYKLFDLHTGKHLETYVDIFGLKHPMVGVFTPNTFYNLYLNPTEFLTVIHSAGEECPPLLKDWPRAHHVEKVGRSLKLSFESNGLSPTESFYDLTTGELLEAQVHVAGFQQTFTGDSVPNVIYNLYTPEGELILMMKGSGKPFPQVAKNWHRAVSARAHNGQITLIIKEPNGSKAQYTYNRQGKLIAEEA